MKMDVSVLLRPLFLGMLLNTPFLLSGCGSGGDSPESAASAPLSPSGSALAGITVTGALVTTSSAGHVALSLGSDVTLSGIPSSDADGDTLTFEWKLVSKPTSSVVALTGSKSTSLHFVPDAMGVYDFLLTVKDGKGALSEQHMLVDVDNHAPVAGSTVDVQFSATPSVKAPQTVNVASVVSLDASGSTDPEGFPVSLNWQLSEKPTGSTASLIVSGKTANFSPDRIGSYKVLVRGTDVRGAYSESVYTFNADNIAPLTQSVSQVSFTAVSSTKPTQSINVGAQVLLDASLSTDPDGDPVTTDWLMVSKPGASQAALVVNGRQARFVADKTGIYSVRVRGMDPKGAYSETLYNFNADNSAPVNQTTAQVSFTAVVVTKPAQDVSVGSLISLDASGSTDPEGAIVTTGWTLQAKPAGSSATLTVANKLARLTPDVVGTYQVLVRGTDPKGAYSETLYTFNANNLAPTTVLTSDITAVSANSGSSTVNTSLGYDIALNGGGSTDPDKDVIAYKWTLQGKPAASQLQLGLDTASSIQFTPDVLGDYVVRLTATDTKGASSYYTMTVKVNNQRPVANISTNATPQSLPGAPAIRLPMGTEVTLRGNTSLDADGDSLTYTWKVITSPTGSVAVLATPNSANTLFVPDKEGTYEFTLRVQDTSGAYSERSVKLNTGNAAPVAVIDKNVATVVSGGTVTASADSSFDEDGDSLTYQWTIDARPVGSKAAIVNPGKPQMSFTPDLPGTYSLAVTVSDGKNNAVAYLGIKALSTSSGSIPLAFMPLQSAYSRGLDRLVMVAANPNSLKTVDPFTGAVRSIALPEAVTAMHLSPNGKLAAVLYNGKASLINLESNTLVKTFSTSGAQTDLFVTDKGVIYLIGQSGGQWVDVGVSSFNGYTGGMLTSCCSWAFYGSQHGIYANKVNRIFLIEEGLSPSDIHFINLDPVTGSVAGTGDSPYHGDYSMYSPMYLTDNQEYVFTSAGNYFSTSSLKYAGKLTFTGYMQSFSHYASTEEGLMINISSSYTYPYSSGLPSEYLLFTGSLLMNGGTLPLPLIDGAQSYGRQIFHSANGSHIILVQTGTNATDGVGAKFYVVYR